MINETDIIKFAKHEFHGGIHPEQNKSTSSNVKSKNLPLADELLLPLYSITNNHNQKQQTKIGDQVHFGQALVIQSNSDSGSNTIAHAPYDAKVLEISEQNLGHSSGLNTLSVRIKKTKNKSQTPSMESFDNWQSESKEALLTRIEDAAIVGLGGAVFPTHIKLTIDKQSIDTLIINAMECEPYITCDHRLIIEQADDILEGALIAARIVGASKLLIGIEDNKAEAILSLETSIKKLSQTTNSLINIIIAPTKYPSGGEKQLIQLLTGQEVPNKSYPASLGIVVQNPATLFAIKKAVVDGFPLTNRLVTITGNACANSGNYWIPFGTSIEYISNQLAIDLTITDEIIFGGPLMGQLINDSAIPTNKSTNCIIFNTTKDLAWGEIESRLSLSSDDHVACIRCGQCETVCPASLIPQQLYWFAKTEQWNELEQQSLFDCIECGACSYVCPSEIPLVGYYRFAKSQIQSNSIKLANSDKAKQRFENREARLARIKFEREAKRRETTAARKKAAEQKPEDLEGKKTAIQDALARVKKKKENTT